MPTPQSHPMQTPASGKARPDTPLIRRFTTLGRQDVPLVGGKNASLGEMLHAMQDQGIQVPDGFATTAHAYWEFLDTNGLREPIRKELADFQAGRKPLEQIGKSIREMIRRAEFPTALADALRRSYRALGEQYGQHGVDVAVRSSATAEDLPEASFAGQQETYLNVSGEADLLEACRNCFASLFTDRAITYREKNGFDHMKVALSVGVQKMVRADLAGAGVMFTLDTESGFPRVVLITAAWGIGENVVQGTVTPDEYMVFKPLLGRGLSPIIEKDRGSKETKTVYAEGGNRTTRNVPTSAEERAGFVLEDAEILRLAEWGVAIERHYGQPMDIEWAKDGQSGELFIVQARPETVQSRRQAGRLKSYRLKQTGQALCQGLSIGDGVAAGRVCRVDSTAEMHRFENGDILVTEMTEPDWGPILKKAAAIVTDTGGRTSHAAIVSREYGIPAIVGTGNATRALKDGQTITVSCAQGNHGVVYEGALPFEVEEVDLQALPSTRTRLMLNLASPDSALHWWQLPVTGVGLARMEFIIANRIRIHPLALTRFQQVPQGAERREIEALTAGYPDKSEYFVEHLSRGIAKIAAAQHPHPVIVRMSDFKSNEYASLLGGRSFEPAESNPMLGFRGASRYYSEGYRDGFALECLALRRVRESMGFDNVRVMIPFCRTLEEADQVLAEMANNGLERGKNGLQVYVMAEIPSNVMLAREFAQRFDGFSIGSNDLTQLTLGVDRDSQVLSTLFDERNEAVKRLITQLIAEAHAVGVSVGICGQAPSDYPEFARFLVEAGIDSISLNPDSVVRTLLTIAQAEAGTE